MSVSTVFETVSDGRGRRDGDVTVVAPNLAGGEVAVIASKEGQMVSEMQPPNWQRGTRAPCQGRLKHVRAELPEAANGGALQPAPSAT